MKVTNQVFVRYFPTVRIRKRNKCNVTSVFPTILVGWRVPLINRITAMKRIVRKGKLHRFSFDTWTKKRKEERGGINRRIPQAYIYIYIHVRLYFYKECKLHSNRINCTRFFFIISNSPSCYYIFQNTRGDELAFHLIWDRKPCAYNPRAYNEGA